MKTSLLQKLVLERYPQCFTVERILDAGCGGGNFENLATLKKLPGRITGVDIKNSVLQKLTKKFPQYHFLRASLLDLLPFKGEEFDTVVMFDVIEHLPRGSEVKVLGELNRVLAEGGFLVITTVYSTWLNFLDPAWYFGHRHYSKNDLSSLVEKAGFAIEEVALVGDLWWELDTLLLYICKHIFKREYSNFLRKKFSAASCLGGKGTRLCLVARKAASFQR